MLAMRTMTNAYMQKPMPQEKTQLATEWTGAQTALSSTAEKAVSQGARAAETGRLASPASGGQEREEERRPDVQTSQSPNSPLQLQPPPAQSYRTSQGLFYDCKPPLHPPLRPVAAQLTMRSRRLRIRLQLQLLVQHGRRRWRRQHARSPVQRASAPCQPPT